MKERVEIQKVYSVKDCNSNPHKTYIFGDNIKRRGKGGQAIIRDCENAWGIPTKIFPDMEESSFFSDKFDEINNVCFELQLLLGTYRKTKYIFVFPADGIGTGRAKLKEKSPLIYQIISRFLKEYFEIDIMP